jgi:hypothetical protein
MGILNDSRLHYFPVVMARYKFYLDLNTWPENEIHLQQFLLWALNPMTVIFYVVIKQFQHKVPVTLRDKF